MSIAKKIAVTLMSVVALAGVVGCSAPEQYHFFVELGDRVGLIQEDPTLEDIAWHIEDAKAEWTPETATPAQNAVLSELARQAAKREEFFRGIEESRRNLQLHPFLTCVRHHESDRGDYPHVNGYGAQNPVSTASGAYQFLDGTWQKLSGMAGYGGYPTAAHAPWWVQDAVIHWTISNPGVSGGRSHWNGTGC